MHLDGMIDVRLTGALALVTHLLFNRIHFREAGAPLLLLITIPATFIIAAHWYLDLVPLQFHWIAADFALYYVCLSLSIIAYRISPLHPLYAFPGPAWARVSKAYGMYISWTGKQHLVLKDLHDKFGPVVRTGPNEVSIADVDAIVKVLGANGFPKGQFYEARSDPHAPKNLVNLSGEEHANRRRLWNRGLSTEALREYEDLIARRAQMMVEKIGEIRGPVDISTWLGYFSFDFMGDFVFSGGFEMLQAGDDEDGLWHVLDEYFRAAAVISHIPWAAKTLARLPILPQRMMQLFTFGAEKAHERVKNGSLKKDLWYHLSDEAGLEKEKPAMSYVIPEGALAIVAGSDSTARTINSLLFFLFSNPQHLARVKEEIAAVFPEGENGLDTTKYGELKFVDACINETLRVYPTVPTNGPRRVPEGTGGRMICGRLIPDGTEIYVPPFVLHRDPRYFSPSPEKFIPERWLKSSSKEAGNKKHNSMKDENDENILNTSAFIPFSYGPQNCVGKTLARIEIKMVLILLLKQYEVRFADGFDKDEWESELCDYFIMHPGKKLEVVLTPRSEVA